MWVRKGQLSVDECMEEEQLLDEWEQAPYEWQNEFALRCWVVKGNGQYSDTQVYNASSMCTVDTSIWGGGGTNQRGGKPWLADPDPRICITLPIPDPDSN